MFDFGTGTNDYMFLTLNAGGGAIRFAITTSAAGGERRINFTGTGELPLNTWSLVTVTLSGSTGTLYVNGTAVGTTSPARPTSSSGSTAATRSRSGCRCAYAWPAWNIGATTVHLTAGTHWTSACPTTGDNGAATNGDAIINKIDLQLNRPGRCRTQTVYEAEQASLDGASARTPQLRASRRRVRPKLPAARARPSGSTPPPTGTRT